MLSNAQLLTIRRASPDDRDVLADLAGLDSARPLHGDVLLAEGEAGAVAAIEVGSGRAVADPFRRSEPALGLLRVRAAQLQSRSQRTHRRGRRSAFARLARAGR